MLSLYLHPILGNGEQIVWHAEVFHNISSFPLQDITVNPPRRQSIKNVKTKKVRVSKLGTISFQHAENRTRIFMYCPQKFFFFLRYPWASQLGEKKKKKTLVGASFQSPIQTGVHLSSISVCSLKLNHLQSRHNIHHIHCCPCICQKIPATWPVSNFCLHSQAQKKYSL